MSYGYYQIVKSIATILFVYFAYNNYRIKDIKQSAITFGALALLFQPFIKVALGWAM